MINAATQTMPKNKVLRLKSRRHCAATFRPRESMSDLSAVAALACNNKQCGRKMHARGTHQGSAGAPACICARRCAAPSGSPARNNLVIEDRLAGRSVASVRTARVPRYHFHFTDGVHWFTDGNGQDLPGLRAARTHA